MLLFFWLHPFFNWIWYFLSAIFKHFLILNPSKHLVKWTNFPQHLHPIDFSAVHLSLGAVISISNLFLYCYFGKLATDSFTSMADCLFDTNWQHLPIELQKYFILIIANMQKPLEYHGFGVAVLNLQTFTEVRKTTDSSIKDTFKWYYSRSFLGKSSQLIWCSKHSHPIEETEHVSEQELQHEFGIICKDAGIEHDFHSKNILLVFGCFSLNFIHKK